MIWIIITGFRGYGGAKQNKTQKIVCITEKYTDSYDPRLRAPPDSPPPPLEGPERLRTRAKVLKGKKSTSNTRVQRLSAFEDIRFSLRTGALLM
jgi:hypothetical protein